MSVNNTNGVKTEKAYVLCVEGAGRCIDILNGVDWDYNSILDLIRNILKLFHFIVFSDFFNPYGNDGNQGSDAEEEEEATSLALGGREGFIFLIDADPSITENPEAFQNCIACMEAFMLKMVISSQQNLVCLFLESKKKLFKILHVFSYFFKRLALYFIIR